MEGCPSETVGKAISILNNIGKMLLRAEDHGGTVDYHVRKKMIN